MAIALFVFHKDWDACISRLRLLRAFNRNLRIYGIFGGEAGRWEEVKRLFNEHLVEIYDFSIQVSQWKWKNTDLVVRNWFLEVGRYFDFDRVYVLQWDMLLFQPLKQAYRLVPPDSVGLTGINPLSAIARSWWWTLAEPHKTEIKELESFARAKYGFQGDMEACLGPGYCLPRKFLDRYGELDIPELGHDEVRLPLFARIMGFPVSDTGFYPRWRDKNEERFFNANRLGEIAEEVILHELQRPNGRRVFHPYRKTLESIAVAMLPQAISY